MKKFLIYLRLIISLPLLGASAFLITDLNNPNTNINKYIINKENTSEGINDELPEGMFYLNDNYYNKYDKIYENDVLIKYDGYSDVNIDEEYVQLIYNPYQGGEIIQNGTNVGGVTFDSKARVLKSDSEGVYVDYLNTTQVELMIDFEGYAINLDTLSFSIYLDNKKIDVKKASLSFNYVFLRYLLNVELDNKGDLFNGTFVYYELNYKARLFEGLIVDKEFIFGDEEKYICVLSTYKQKQVYKTMKVNIVEQKGNYCKVSGNGLQSNMKIVAPASIL